VMDENFRPIVSGDKAESLAIIEPFHRSLSHFFSLPFYFLMTSTKKNHKVKSLCGRLNAKTSN
jgi:hypothetical protein